jgi:hypothetical protein
VFPAHRAAAVYLEICSIPKNDAQEQTNEIVVQLGQKIGVGLKKEDITTSHRLPTKVKANGERSMIPPDIISIYRS